MGTGKTVIGRAVAERLGMEYADMDDLIEELEGTSISEIFATKGEPYFRKVESEVARDVSGRSGLVIATGGGVVLNYENVRVLESTGTGICLNVSPEVIYERVKDETHRPLLDVDDPLGRIRDMLEYRKPFYARVAHQVDAERPVVEIVEEIISIAGEPRD